MKYLLLCAVFLAVMTSASAQENPDCGWYGTKTVTERNAMFPFNKAKKVVLVSYPCLFGTCVYEKDMDTAMKEFNGIRKLDFAIGNKKERTYIIKEEVILSEVWINEISNVLINYTVKEKLVGGYGAGLCYMPQHAVLFYDENDKIICCYEICFECDRIAMWPDADSISDYYVTNNCPDFFKELKFIFRKNGITYGLDEN